MSSQRLNVLVYTGPGTTVESVKHCIWSLRRLLSPNYAVAAISDNVILKEPWTATCALLVIPGGADLGYCRVLNGHGNARIKQYVNKGGAYLGLCAGGYYASARCEFEEGDPRMAVVGDRELAFFPGTCRGLAYPGFIYHTEAGTRAAAISVDWPRMGAAPDGVPAVFRTYYNGGGVFVDASAYRDRGVEVLAEYTDKVDVASGDGQAAVVYCKVGQGAAILTSPHPEFAAANLGKGEGNAGYPQIVDTLAKDDIPRVQFMKACLVKLGLKVSQDGSSIPSLSALHVTSVEQDAISTILQALENNAANVEGRTLLKAEHDSFSLQQNGAWDMEAVSKALPSSAAEQDRMLDYNDMVKTIVFNQSSLPEARSTPYFNHSAFYTNLDHFQARSKVMADTFGRTLIYGEVVTSTNTILEKNPSLTEHLPTGTTFTATTQVAGRGRGSNVWVSPPGSLMFSVLLRHPLALNATAPVVCVQYLLALAIVGGIRSYDKGYASLPVRLKWPNDIYALDPRRPAPPTGLASSASSSSSPSSMRGPGASGALLSDAERARFVKIGGILISSSYTAPLAGGRGGSGDGVDTTGGGSYTLVCGAGVNVANAAPTTSLDALAAAHGLAPFAPEKLLAAILVAFEALYERFCAEGFGAGIRREYEALWLHTGQVVEVEAAVVAAAAASGRGWDGVGSADDGREERFVVRGVDPEWGLLVVEKLVGWETGSGRATGRRFELQSDSNSFDFFKGLVKRKI